MQLGQILIATLAAGIGSVWLAAILGWFALRRFNRELLSLAAGALLATALMHLLPEAFETAAVFAISAQSLFTMLLIGVVFFFLLDKAELYHHGHEHHATGHAHLHEPHHAHTSPGNSKSGGWAVLLGDSIHAFGDGVVIAAAFAAGQGLGWATALAVLSHEVPHHMGDLIVLGQERGQGREDQAGRATNARVALIKVSLAGTVTTMGGVVGYLLLEKVKNYLPYVLVLAASSFIYVALADLIPQLQRRVSLRETLLQILWLLVGMLLVVGTTQLVH